MTPKPGIHSETLYAHAGLCVDKETGSISTPIYQTATFRHHGVGKSTGFDYSRSSNPTRAVVEKTLASIEHGFAGFAFSSGMAAITAIGSLFKPGDRIILSQDIYGGTYRYFDRILRPIGIVPVFIDTSNNDAVHDALQEKTAAVFIETPGNPLMRITDIRQVSTLARAAGAMTVVDNTFMTPYLQKPLQLGADIVVHSGTKFLGGHNDLLAGIVVTKTKADAERIAFIQNATGGILSPFDSWLLLRGIKTLAVRMDRAQSNAVELAGFLNKHKNVSDVYYPVMTTGNGHSLHDKQARGGGAILSFRTKTDRMAYSFLEKVKVISFAESLGGVETLVTHPALQTHADMPESYRKATGVTNNLLRISVGIEHIGDLIEDTKQALS